MVSEANNWPEKAGYCLIFILLSVFPTYFNLLHGYGHAQVFNHLDFLKNNSPYFNPWQYRVLAPYISEGFHQILAHTLYSLVPTNDPYTFTFKVFRTLQNLFILISIWKFYNYFTSSKTLKLIALVIVSGAFSFGAHRSDFSLNTYFDIQFYVLAAWLILGRKNIIWLLPLTILAALNRETSIFIPLLPLIDYKHYFSAGNIKKTVIIILSSLLAFAVIFILIRLHYGYIPPSSVGRPTGWPIFSFNVTNLGTILQLFATLSVLPLIVLFNIKRADQRLQILFWMITPVWFAVHFWLVWVRETRLFLVPLVIILIPIVLNLIQKEFEPAQPVRET